MVDGCEYDFANDIVTCGTRRDYIAIYTGLIPLYAGINIFLSNWRKITEFYLVIIKKGGIGGISGIPDKVDPTSHQGICVSDFATIKAFKGGSWL